MIVTEHHCGDCGGGLSACLFFIPKMIADIASGHISMEYGYHGPNYGVVSACASSNNAIIDAFNYIRLGKADAFITGGAEAAIYPAGVGGFNSMHALSTRNDSPAFFRTGEAVFVSVTHLT